MKNDNSKNDLRIRRTYKLLYDSLFDLLSKKNFDDITVTDICENAMVHRTTFYKHFEDKNQLLNYCIKEFQIRFSEENKNDFKCDNLSDYYFNIVHNVLEFTTSPQNKAIFISLINNNINTLQTIFHEAVVEDVMSKLELVAKNGTELLVPIPILAEFHTGSILSIMRWWFENNMPIPVEDLIKYATSLCDATKNSVIKKSTLE